MQIIQLAADATLQAASKGQPRRFLVDPAYSGGTVPGYTAKADLPIVVDLATLAPRNEHVVANLDHKPDARVGHVDTVTNNGKTLTLAGVVSAATPAAQEFLASAASGFPWSASIEAELSTLERIERGKSVSVNGQSFTGPIYVARGARLTAIAFVSTGADPTARAFAASQRGRQVMDPIVQAEQDRIQQIELLCSGEFGSEAGTVAQLKAEAIAGALSPEELRQGVLKALRASRVPAGSFRTHAPSRPELDNTVISAAICLAGGLTAPEKHFPERVLDAADHVGRGIGLQQLLMRAACNAGYQAGSGEYVTQGNLRSVLTAAFQPTMQASWSTLSVSGILSNVANKFLLDGWREMGDEWRSISAIKPVKDFKTNTFYRMLDSLEYEQVGGGGEIKHGTLGEQAAMTVTAATYGKMLGVTRTDIINDDLEALTDAPRRLGRAAAMKFRRIFWAAFLAADSFFDSANGNVKTGSGTALTAAGTALESALATFRAQRTSAADGRKMIGGKPAVMMVPGSLGIIARRLLNSSNIVSGTDGMIPSGNPYQGLAQLVEVDWLEDTTFTGYSAAKWYLFRSPSLAPAMIVAFLNGRESPTVETAEADFNTLGISMRGYHDFGFGRGEPLCGLQVAGTA